jgi:SNF2 family DNA or RNA helicase
VTSWAAIDSTVEPPRLAIGCPKAEHHLAEQIPGCNYDKADGIWRVDLSWPAYACLREVWGSQPLDIRPSLAKYGEACWQGVQERYAMRQELDAPPHIAREIDAIEKGAERKLFLPQRGGTAWLVRWRRDILGDPQGNGKTPMVIRALQVLEQRGQGGGLPAVVVAPGAALYNWKREFDRWAPELKVSVVDGTALRRRRALEEPADVYVMAWSSVRTHTRLARYPGVAFARCPEHGGQDPKTTPGRCDLHEKELNRKGFRIQTVIADEAHRMQDARSKQTRAVWWLAHHAENFWAVTGTMIGDTINDLWPILHGIDPRAWPSRSRYLDLFAIKEYAWHGGMEVLDIRPDTARTFHSLVQPLIRRIPKEIARPWQPPRLDPVFRYPEMPPAQARVYKQLRKELLADLEPSTIVPANSGVLFSRLCQMAVSTVEVTHGEDAQGFTTDLVRMTAPSSKADDLLDFIMDEPTDQLVVAANSPQLIELMTGYIGKFKITSSRIVGGMTSMEKDSAAEMFQRGDVQVCFINAAGSEAITLTAASTIFFAQPDPVFRSREQKIGRVDRIGQEKAVRVIYSITPHTVEEGLFQLGEEKAERVMNVTRDADLLRWIVTGAEPAESGQGVLFDG